MSRTAWSLLAAINMLGIGHHFDHAFRHHLVGWPFADQFTGFTVALLFYVVVVIGILLTRRGVVGPGFWSILAAVSFVFMVGSHFGPVAEDPISNYVPEY